ncbi:MAG: TetR/AcrR family transcriptional regulator [Actinomycetota bacterium]
MVSRQANRRNMASGRVNQKTRTRHALLQAAVDLVRQGKPPSMAEAAELALVSAATAYRYFPSAQALWEEASLELTEPWELDVIDAAGEDPAARLDAVVQSIGWHMLDEEVPYRNLARASLERWFREAGLPEHERVPVREARRMRWNAKALEPLRDQLPEPTIDQLVNALALVWGTEAVVVLRDVCRLDVEEAKRVMLNAARWMLEGALALTSTEVVD